MGLERGCPESGLSCNQGERLEFAPYWPICASSAQQPVNRKRSRLEAKIFGSANVAEYEVVLTRARCHQMSSDGARQKLPAMLGVSFSMS